MKKHILSAALVLGGLTAFSQITIDRSSYAVPGDWFLIATDTTIDVNTSNALKLGGANQSWNLKGWAKRNTVDTTFYADGFTYPGAPAGCNLVSFERDPLTMEEIPSYYNISNTAIRAILEAGPTSGSGGAIKMYQFPSTMGTKFVDSSENYFTILASDFGIELPLIDSLRITYKIKVNSEIDAHGKLTLNAGEFDVIRQVANTNVTVGFKIRNTITGTYSDLPGFGNVDESSNLYSWLSANGGHPLLTATSDTLGNIFEIEYVLASSRGLTSGLQKVSTQNTIRVYPNPAKESLSVDLTASQNGVINYGIYDILGNEVLSASNISVNKGLNQIPVDLSGIKAGVYFINLIQGDVKTSQRFIVE